MKMNKRVQGLLDNMLNQIDFIGYKLDEIGVENNINRHNLFAYATVSQKRVEGELDSLSAKIDKTKSKADALLNVADQYAKSGAELAMFPAKYVMDRINSQIKK